MESRGGLAARHKVATILQPMPVARTQLHAHLPAEEAGKCSLAVSMVTKSQDSEQYLPQAETHRADNCLLTPHRPITDPQLHRLHLTGLGLSQLLPLWVSVCET